MTATIYAPNGTISTDNATAAVPNIMKGQFIGKKVNGQDYTYWYENTDCPCTVTSGGSMLIKTPATDNESIVKQDATLITPASIMSIKAYPNPFSNEVHLRVYTMDTKTPINVKIFDASGVLQENRTDITYDSGDILIGRTLPGGIYLIQVTQGKNIQVARVVKVE